MSRGAAAARRAAGYLLVAAAAWFLYRTVAANWQELEGFRWRVRWGMLAASVAAHVGVLAFGVLVWSRVMRHVTPRPLPFSQLLRVWSYSNVARYIPGSVWQFVAAARLSREAGLPGVLALTSMLVHVALTLLAAVTIALLLLPMRQLGLDPLEAPWIRAAGAAASLLCVHPAVIDGALRLVPRALHREVLRWSGRWRDGILLLALAHGSWLLYGLAYALFVASLAPVPPGALPVLTAVNALSFVAGYLAVLVPGGLGVRESAMTLLLTPLVPAGVAAVLAVGARLWSVAAEVLLAAAGSVLAGRRRAHRG